MNSQIKKGRFQFNNENYEKALKYFDAVDESDEDYEYVLIFKITCLMELERYDKALFLIDSLLAESPGDELMLYEKVRCHIAMDEKPEALETLKKFEKAISKDDKRMILDVARFYKILGEYNSALRFCNMALSVDDEFYDAIYEKSLVAIALNNAEIIDNCANKLLRLNVDNKFGLVPIFLLKLYSNKFRDCADIIDRLDDELEGDTCELLRNVVYSQLCQTLDVNVYLSDDADIPIGEAINLLLDYDDYGTKHGVVDGVGFTIM